MKLKRKLLFHICCLFAIVSKSQPLIINTQLPNTGMFYKEQLWNIAITNNTQDVVEARCNLDIIDLASSQSVLNAVTPRIFFRKGINMLSNRDVQPITYNFLATDFSGNYLPCGTYRIHYRLTVETDKGERVVGDEVGKFTISPLSPPLLSFPQNKQGIQELYPQFVWNPPTPMSMFNPLLYNLSVVEINEGQLAKEALEINNPVYANFNLQQPFDKMPTSFTSLVKGKKYAWQVTAHSGELCLSPSEVYVFFIGQDSTQANINAAPFIKLSANNTELSFALQGLLKMEYFNAANDKRITCTVFKAGERLKSNRVHKFTLKLVPGQNFLTYDLSKKAKLDPKIIYEVMVENAKGEKYFMRFTPNL
jgi:hypothetical protein